MCYELVMRRQINMELRGSCTLLLLLLAVTWCLTKPVPGGKIDKNAAKRTLDDSQGVVQPELDPLYGIYPGIKPLRPMSPPGLIINSFATSMPPLDPVATFFRTKKDEFLNKLFNKIILNPEAPEIEVRSAVDTTNASEDTTPSALSTTPKPKIDPSVFISKKFDFLAQLFKTLNTTTPIPNLGDVSDPTATTVKPTIVPPGFWVPFPKTPKPLKSIKPPKPEKTKNLLLSPIDETLLKSMLSDIDPTNSDLGEKLARAAEGTKIPPISFLDKLLHRVTDVPPTTTAQLSATETRSLFLPSYWIPPYIYAAKMGIYLDKIFDTIDKAASTDEYSPEKRSTTPESDSSALILNELTALKDKMITAYAEGLKSTKTTFLSAKPTPKPFKKTFWGLKTTPLPDTTLQKIELLSNLFDELVSVEQQLITGSVNASSTTEAATEEENTTNFWAPDPTAADIGDYYKIKTQKFLTQLFADKSVAPEDPEV